MYIITKDGSWSNAFDKMIFEDINQIITFLIDAYTTLDFTNIPNNNIKEQKVIGKYIHEHSFITIIITNLLKDNSTESIDINWRILSIPTYQDAQLPNINEEESLSNILNTFKHFYL